MGARMAKEAEAAAAAKKKKGFMTPARKSKLRMLLRQKAAEELKKQEERNREERRRIATESSKYDLELKLIYNDFVINDLTQQVSDLRGKFVKPKLKKVAKFEDKFAQLNKKASEFKWKAELSKGD